MCENRGNGRLDVVEWTSLQDWIDRFLSGQLATHPSSHQLVGILAVLTDGELSFEYPNRVGALLTGLETLGVNVADFLVALGKVAAVNYLLTTTSSGALNTLPLRVLIGTPSRRMSGKDRRQHLVCWQVDDLGRRIAEGLIWERPPDELAAELGRRMTALLKEWMPSAIAWVEVMEARREVTVRRDIGSAAQWLCGRRVLILGAGALGAPVAEHCVRAGAGAVTIVDNGRVAPGILVRQPYGDADVHRYKADALAERLNGLRDDHPVVGVVANAEAVVSRGDSEIHGFDLVIDATADASVASLLERCRALRRTDWPHLLSLVVGHNARRGIVTVSRPGGTGAGRDILRRLTLTARGYGEARLADIADDFFPREPRTALFQPEPGCSSPTFTGSAAELSALAGHLLDAGLTAIGQDSGTGTEPMVAAVVRLGSGRVGRFLHGLDWFEWPNDVLVPDLEFGYEVRISHAALGQMRAECRRGRRLRGRGIETGGTIFGRMDNACRCIWIDDVSGPPPDSRLSAFHLDHGIEGLRELIDYHRKRSGMATTYLGMWHSHPDGAAAPSEMDAAGMHTLVSEAVGGPPRGLILILGGDPARWGRWLAGEDIPDVFAEVIRRRKLGPQPARPRTPLTHEDSWWPGGWKSARVDAAWPRRRSWLSRLWPLKH
jgi:integrative and conjugative element protein (TIGR02256 family)